MIRFDDVLMMKLYLHLVFIYRLIKMVVRMLRDKTRTTNQFSAADHELMMFYQLVKAMKKLKNKRKKKKLNYKSQKKLIFWDTTRMARNWRFGEEKKNYMILFFEWWMIIPSFDNFLFGFLSTA